MLLKRFFLMILLVGAIGISTQAQFELPPQVREAAIQAANDALPNLGRPDRWEFERLAATTDSSLGCPLVTGVALPGEVTPYRVLLYYGDTAYTVYVSTDGTRTQLCDQRFGDAMTANTSVSPTGCVLTAAVDSPLYSLPDLDTAVAEITVAAGSTGEAPGRTRDTGWYQIQVGAVIGWIPASNVTPGENCDNLPVTASVDPNATGTCFITPSGSFANVRAQATTDSPQVDTIFENSSWQVLAQNTGSSWYYIEPGWVSVGVVIPTGDCASVQVRDDLVGLGGLGDTSEPLDSEILANFACPLGYEGYMTPNIRIGEATARVANQGVPNTLRTQPNVDDTIGERIGQIQPGRTLNTVLNGPACNQGFVWWLVEIDGTTGWTAESNAESREYYLLPTEGNAVITTPLPTLTPLSSPTATEVVATQPVPAPSVTPTPENPVALNTAAPTASTDEVSTSILRAVKTLETGVAVRKVLLSTDLRRVFVLSEDGGEIRVREILSGLDTGEPIISDSPVLDMINFGDGLVTAHLDGTVRLWNPETLAETSRLEDFMEANGGVLLSADKSFVLLAKGGCAETDANGSCVSGSVDVYEAASGALLRAQPAHPAIPIQVLISQDDRFLASSAVDGVQIWELQSGAFVTAFAKDPQFPINNIVFSPDSNLLLWGSCAEIGTNESSQPGCIAGDVRLWDIANSEAVLTLNDHEGDVQAVAFHPDGSLFATAGTDNRVFLYDTATGEQLLILTEHSADVNTLLFSADGDLLISGSDDGKVVIRDIGGR